MAAVLVKDRPGYDVAFPEKYQWSLIDQRTVSEVAERLAALVVIDMKTVDRNYVPGLRKALDVIAGYATIQVH